MLRMSEKARIVLVKPAQAAGGGPIVSDSVDMFGYNSVLFFGSMGAVVGNSVKAAISEDGAAFTDLDNATVAPAAAGGVWALDLHRPIGGRHVHVEVDRSGTDTAHGEIYALLHDAKEVPVTQSANVTVTVLAGAEPAAP